MFFDLLFSASLEFLVELTKILDSDKVFREVATIWLCVVGAGVGGLSAWVAPLRILPSGPVLGVSIVTVPIVVGCAMQLWGLARQRREQKVSHLATWYGGAALGLGLALGRLVGLRILKAL
jgi:hypothetical protein